MPTLDSFLNRKEKYLRNAWVKEPGFESLYVRYSTRLIEGTLHKNVLDISNVTAEKPGSGAFKAMISRLRKEYPDLTIFVENALTERFQEGLIRMGFTPIPGSSPLCLYMLGDKEKRGPVKFCCPKCGGQEVISDVIDVFHVAHYDDNGKKSDYGLDTNNYGTENPHCGNCDEPFDYEDWKEGKVSNG